MKLKPNIKEILRNKGAYHTDPDILKRVRLHLAAHIAANPAAPGLDRGSAPKERRAIASPWFKAATAGMAVVAASAGTAFAAEGSLPGQVLYPVKRAIEDVQVALTPAPTAKASLLIHLAGERVAEIQALAKEPNASSSPAVQQDAATALGSMYRSLEQASHYSDSPDTQAHLQASINLYRNALAYQSVPAIQSSTIMGDIVQFQNQIEGDMQRSQNAESQAATGGNISTAAQRNIDSTKNAIKRTEADIERSSLRNNPNLAATASSSISEAKTLLQNAEDDLSHSQAQSAFDQAQAAMTSLSQARAAVTAPPNLEIEGEGDARANAAQTLTPGQHAVNPPSREGGEHEGRTERGDN